MLGLPNLSRYSTAVSLPGPSASSSALSWHQCKRPQRPRAVRSTLQRHTSCTANWVTLPAQVSLTQAMQSMHEAIDVAENRLSHHAAGCVRLEVPIPRDASALTWLQGQPQDTCLHPRIYFSPRASSAPSTPGGDRAEASMVGSGAVAGAGSAWLWQGQPGQAVDEALMQDIQSFLDPSSPRLRALGGGRFDQRQSPSREWAEFGSYIFMLPRLELMEAAGCSLLSCTLAWGPPGGLGSGPSDIHAAAGDARAALRCAALPAAAAAPAVKVERTSQEHVPDREQWDQQMGPLPATLKQTNEASELSNVDPAMALDEYNSNGQDGLDDLLAILDGDNQDDSGMVEEAGMSKLVLARQTNVHFNGSLDPLNLLAALQERDPRSYQLFIQLSSGATFFGITPENLYTKSGRSVASEAVAATRPRGPPGDVEADFFLAFDLLRNPKDHFEFTQVRNWIKRALMGVCDVVTVEREKSVLKQSTVQHLYARLAATLKPAANDATLLAALHPTPATCGRPQQDAFQALRDTERFDRVGIVKGSTPEEEWGELELKVRQFQGQLRPSLQLAAMPNINLLWASLLAEELCRLGCNTFCIAPGSRSSPLTAAVAMQPRSVIVPCIDERSLGFWALGHAKATGKPAVVITSSGTAVANLFPAVIEAAQSGTPLLILSADRPPELRDTGANQTIDQIKIFGGYARWFSDIPAPSDSIPARTVLTTVDSAVRMATAGPMGPVHLNCQFREPLTPAPSPWQPACLQGLERWEAGNHPFTINAGPLTSQPLQPLEPGLNAHWDSALHTLKAAKRGLVVVGELQDGAEGVAALQIARCLGWPIAVDVLSGLRVGASSGPGANEAVVLTSLDHILLEKQGVWEHIQPDAVLQLGGHFTSKRILSFLEWSALPQPARPGSAWLFASIRPYACSPPGSGGVIERQGRQSWGHIRVLELMRALDEAAGEEIHTRLESMAALNEMHVAKTLAALLPPGDGLFLGNSMPVRDMDMGASGIDGVISSAAGFAAGLGRPVTVAIGDVSFLHDINGLNLLRTGEADPPLTVLLINNGGGSIFSFLPIADSLPPDTFNRLWTTPQNVDLSSICRAHGIPHQNVSQLEDLGQALRSAWGLRRHSVVEVKTPKEGNVDLHRQLQASVAAAVRRTLNCFLTPAGLPGSLRSLAASQMEVTGASLQPFCLPLQRPLTTEQGESYRHGILLRLHGRIEDQEASAIGIGEASPLPGLHTETVEETEMQLRLLCQLLPGLSVPWALPLLQVTLFTL
ncbi:hypothetical protein WJX84_001736 [Apatococcus fuscideae]|uniref:Isochorismate synthase n=1 Tax=Apatococcus fuscideae TaxID=2026836 RepID=A0AAW1SLC9_9CHLO